MERQSNAQRDLLMGDLSPRWLQQLGPAEAACRSQGQGAQVSTCSGEPQGHAAVPVLASTWRAPEHLPCSRAALRIPVPASVGTLPGEFVPGKAAYPYTSSLLNGSPVPKGPASSSSGLQLGPWGRRSILSNDQGSGFPSCCCRIDTNRDFQTRDTMRWGPKECGCAGDGP